MWCIQEITPEYRRRMHDILNLYEEAYNPKRPVIGIDEKPKQLIEDSRKPIPMKKGKVKKQDYEYIRRGKVNIFMAVEPKGGTRCTQVTTQRTKRDFAFFVKELVDKRYRCAKLLRIVADNLNTHNKSSFYETFDQKEARRILSRIEFHYTPTHASWLNVAEIEIGVMDAECTNRRIKSKDLLTEEVEAWSKRRNKQRKKINWTFTKQKADKKLGKYYTE
jgi:hypothetical protein